MRREAYKLRRKYKLSLMKTFIPAHGPIHNVAKLTLPVAQRPIDFAKLFGIDG